MADRKLIVELIGNDESLRRAFSRSTKDANKFAASMQRTRRSLSALAGVGIGLASLGAGVRSTVGAFAEFDDAMQRIVGLSGVAQNAVNGFRGEVLKLAPQVGKGPQELAEALFFITSSGVEASKALGVLSASAKASAAGLGQTQVVADAVTSAMNAYGAANLSAKQATDVLVATVREGKGEADQFAGVIGNVTAVASQLGVSFNDVGGALAAITRLGTDAATASVELQQVFSALLKQSPQAEKAFKSVGLSTAGLRKELRERGLLETLQTLKDAFGENVVATRRAFADERAFRGVLALVGNQASTTAGILDRLARSTGSTDSAFAAVSGDSLQRFKRFQAAVEVVKIQVGSALAPAFEKAATSLTKWLSVTDNQEKVQRAATAALKQVQAAVTGLVAVFKAMHAVIAPVVRALGGLEHALQLIVAVAIANKLAKIKTSLVNIGGGAATASGKVGKLQTALSRLPAQVGVVITVAFIVNQGAKELDQFLHGRFPGVFGKNAADAQVNEIIDAAKANKVNTQKDVDKILAAFKAFGTPAETIAAARKALQAEFAAGQQRAVQALAKPLGAANRTAGFAGADAAIVAGSRAAPDRARLSAEQRNQFFDAAIGRAEDRVQDITALQGQLGALQKIAGLVSQRLAKTKDITRRLTLEDKLRDIFRQEKAIKQQMAEDVTAALGVRLVKAEATATLKDDIREGARLIANLQNRIQQEGKTTDLEEQLFQAQQDQIARIAEQRQRRQFQALGLGPTGDAIIPSVKNLQKQLQSLSTRIAGTKLDTKKIRSQLERFRKVLTDPIDRATRDTRAKIAELLQSIRDGFEDKGGLLTKTKALDTSKIVEGLGLDAATSRQIRARLSKFNTAGRALAGPTVNLAATGATVGAIGGQFVIENKISLDGRPIEHSTTRHQERRSRRNPHSRRGR